MVKFLLITTLFLLFLALPFLGSSTHAKETAVKNTILNDQVLSKYPSGSPEEKKIVANLFSRRPAERLSPFNIAAYGMQSAYKIGVSLDILILVLAIPIIATIVVFFRYIIGLPTLGIVTPIVLSITFIAIGIFFSIILLVSLLLATFTSRLLLQKVRIMQLTKVAISMLFISVFILPTLALSLQGKIITPERLSIFPVLLFILLSERVVALQIENSLKNALRITSITVLVGTIGYFIIATPFIRDTLLLYPELLIILIPINYSIGKYFGLRLTEYYRFVPKIRNANK